MGCCCSTSMIKSESHVPKPTKHQLSPESDQYHKSLPIHDEETVKEVLSETHFPKSPSQLQKTAITITQSCESTRGSQQYIKKDELTSPVEITTENSDFRGLTDSLSTTTTITTVAEENREDDGEVNQCRVSHKAPGKIPRKRNIPGSVTGGGVGRSPARRPAQLLPVKTAHAKVSSVQTPPARLRSAGSSGGRGIRSSVRGGEAGVVLHRPARQRSPNNVKPLMREENPNPIVYMDLECFIFL